MKWAFLGGFLAVVVVLAVVIWIIRRKIRQASRQLFGTEDLLSGLSELDLETDNHPRSLNGCDQIVLPDILADFPDFDITLAKIYVRDYITGKLADKQELTVHKIVISRYLQAQTQKTIVFQAAVSYREQNRTVQKRFTLHYSFLLSSRESAVAANCPNCGGTLGFGMTTCPYCNSRVANVMGNTWKFTQMQES